MITKEIIQAIITSNYLIEDIDKVYNYIHISTIDQEYYFFCDNKTWSDTNTYDSYGKLMIEPVSDSSLRHIYEALIYHKGFRLSFKNMLLINQEEYDKNVARR